MALVLGLCLGHGCGLRQRTHHPLVEPEHEPRAAIRHEPYIAGLARLEPHSGSRRNVEAMTERRLSIERQRRVGLGEMKMTAHLNRTVTRVRDREHDGRSVPIQDDVAGRWKNLAGRHVSATIARAPPNAAIPPIVRNATLPIDPLVRQHIAIPDA